MAKLDNANYNMANITEETASIGQIGLFLCPGDNSDYLTNFIMCGSYVSEYYGVLERYLTISLNNCPILLLHHKSLIELYIKKKFSNVLSNCCFLGDNDSVYQFEPFYNMDTEKIVSSINRLAKCLEYKVNAYFDGITRTIIRMVELSGNKPSLSSFVSLCSYHSLVEFYNRLECIPNKEEKDRLFAGLALDKEDRMEQFQLFRNVILSFSYEMSQSGWKVDNSRQKINFMSCLKTNTNLLSYSIENTYTSLFLNYLVEELRTYQNAPFILLLDNIKLDDEFFVNYLIHPNINCRYGIIAESISALANMPQEKQFYELAENVDSYIMFKHRTATSAEFFSKIVGNYDAIQEQISEGTNKENFALLRKNIQTSTQRSLVNRYRVMPEDIIGLSSREACVYNSQNNTIHFISF